VCLAGTVCLSGTAAVLREGRVGFEKGECKNAEGGDRSFWHQNELRVFFLVRGDPVERVPKVSKGSEVRSFQSSVHSGTCGHRAGDRRMEAATGVGRSRHRRVEGRCSPTSAGVRRRPEPSLRHGCAIRSGSGPGRTPALSPPAGRLALRVGGQEGTACLDRAARHVSLLVWNRALGAPQRAPGVGGGSWRRRALPAAAPPGRSWVATAAARWR
jgi:hypothetical protein